MRAEQGRVRAGQSRARQGKGGAEQGPRQDGAGQDRDIAWTLRQGQTQKALHSEIGSNLGSSSNGWSMEHFVCSCHLDLQRLHSLHTSSSACQPELQPDLSYSLGQ